MCAHEPSPNVIGGADPGLVTVTLASLAPGSVAQVVSIQAGLDAGEREALESAGVLPGTRLRVLSVSEGGAVEVQASRALTSVSRAVAAAILVVPGDLAAISDQVARDRH